MRNLQINANVKQHIDEQIRTHGAERKKKPPTESKLQTFTKKVISNQVPKQAQASRPGVLLQNPFLVNSTRCDFPPQTSPAWRILIPVKVELREGVVTLMLPTELFEQAGEFKISEA